VCAGAYARSLDFDNFSNSHWGSTLTGRSCTRFLPQTHGNCDSSCIDRSYQRIVQTVVRKFSRDNVVDRACRACYGTCTVLRRRLFVKNGLMHVTLANGTDFPSVRDQQVRLNAGRKRSKAVIPFSGENICHSTRANASWLALIPLRADFTRTGQTDILFKPI
jgi:hypothetical protein